jgi:hypothetical protein
VAPAFTSTAPKSATANATYSYTMTASGSPAPTFAKLAGPSWLSVTGNVLSGTPATTNIGVNAVTVTATNTQGTVSQSFTIVVQSVTPVQLVLFDFNGIATSPGPATFPAAVLNTNVLENNTLFGRGSGVDAVSGASANVFSATNYAITTTAVPNPTLDRANNDFVTFTLTPKAGISIDMTQLKFDTSRSNTGPVNGEVWSDANSFASAIGSFTIATGSATKTFTLPSNFDAIVAPVEFRLYSWAATQAGGNARFDNVEVLGNVASTLPSAGGGQSAGSDPASFVENFGEERIPAEWAVSSDESVLMDRGAPLLIGTASLATPRLDLTSATEASLRFRHHYDLPAGAVARVEISTDDGKTFRGLTDGGSWLGTSESGDFEWAEIDLAPDLAGEPLDKVRLRFAVYTEDPKVVSTWRIDDVVAGDRSALPVLNK